MGGCLRLRAALRRQDAAWPYVHVLQLSGVERGQVARRAFLGAFSRGASENVFAKTQVPQSLDALLLRAALCTAYSSTKQEAPLKKIARAARAEKFRSFEKPKRRHSSSASASLEKVSASDRLLATLATTHLLGFFSSLLTCVHWLSALPCSQPRPEWSDQLCEG